MAAETTAEIVVADLEVTHLAITATTAPAGIAMAAAAVEAAEAAVQAAEATVQAARVIGGIISRPLVFSTSGPYTATGATPAPAMQTVDADAAPTSGLASTSFPVNSMQAVGPSRLSLTPTSAPPLQIGVDPWDEVRGPPRWRTTVESTLPITWCLIR